MPPDLAQVAAAWHHLPEAVGAAILALVSAAVPLGVAIGKRLGKTTLLQHLCEPKRKYVTLDDPNLRAPAQEDPGLFLQRFEPPVLIDEIQYGPRLPPLIKALAKGRGLRNPES
jgi:hypothetical protein